jgi:protein TonB
MTLVALPQREPAGRRAGAAAMLLAFPARRFPPIELAPEGGPAPPVVAPRREFAAPAGRGGWKALAVSAVLHCAVVGIALGETAGAMSSGSRGVLQVTLVAALPPAPAVLAPKVPALAPRAPTPPRQAMVPRVPVPVSPVVRAAEAARPAAAVAEAPVRAPARLAAPVVIAAGEIVAPPDVAGRLPPLPAAHAEAAVRRSAGLAAPGRAEAPPVVAPPPPVPNRAERPKRAKVVRKAARKPAPAGGRARGAGAGTAAGRGGRAAAPAPGAGARALIAAWGARITAGVERHKHYPLAAAGAGGVTGVALSVARDGRLVAAHVARSSGVAALDLAAVRAVQAAAPFPPAPEGLTAARYAFTLRVKFGG